MAQEPLEIVLSHSASHGGRAVTLYPGWYFLIRLCGNAHLH